MPMTGCGVNRKGTNPALRSSLTTDMKAPVVNGAVGMLYFCSRVIAQSATADTQPIHPPTPITAASPLALISSHNSCESSRKALPALRLRTVVTDGMFFWNQRWTAFMNL